MKTVGGIYLDLKESEFFYKYNGLKFFFSSQMYLQKFKLNVGNYVKEENIKLKNRYKIKCDFSIYLLLSYYKQIEKRGFYVLGLNNEKINDTLSLIIN